MMSDSTTTDSPETRVADEVFIKLDNTSTPSKTVRVVINNFLKEIEESDEEQPEERFIESPEFEIAGFKFRMYVYPKKSGQIGVYLVNENNIDLTVTYHIKVSLRGSKILT